MATLTRRRGVGTTVRALEDSELARASDIAWYAETVNALLGRLAIELETTATEVERALRASGGGFTDRMHARWAARKAVAPLRKAATHARVSGHFGLRFWRAYSDAYAQLINPAKGKKRKTFDHRS